ncbi:MAG: D-alanyl-D-alanine carboxypeptidase, partial [Hyphomicrobiaceae bacterium]|nr:D-alanyl-D-alanine carboxypeptidase [Hyphomicrobiaceae bacterium]
PLLFLDIGADGLKTGFLSESGYGVVGSAKQGTRRLIVAMNGLATKEDRKTEARKLLEWGFRSFSEFKIFDAGEVVGQALVWGGERMYVPLTGNGDIKILLPRFNLKQTLSASIVYQSPLKAPIKKGDQIAVLRVVTSAQATNEVPLYAAEDVPAGGFMRKGLHSLLHLAFKWVL